MAFRHRAILLDRDPLQRVVRLGGRTVSVRAGECSPTFALDHAYSWTHRGRPASMHPNYAAELDRLRSGELLVLLRVGSRARITIEGEHFGVVGKIVKRGRTSYHLRAGRAVLRVPFSCVEPVRAR